MIKISSFLHKAIRFTTYIAIFLFTGFVSFLFLNKDNSSFVGFNISQEVFPSAQADAPSSGDFGGDFGGEGGGDDDDDDDG